MLLVNPHVVLAYRLTHEENSFGVILRYGQAVAIGAVILVISLAWDLGVCIGARWKQLLFNPCGEISVFENLGGVILVYSYLMRSFILEWQEPFHFFENSIFFYKRLVPLISSDHVDSSGSSLYNNRLGVCWSLHEYCSFCTSPTARPRYGKLFAFFFVIKF